MESSDRKLFSVLVDGELTEIWERPLNSHQDGRDNGCPDTWWVKKVFGTGDFEWIPFLNRFANRPCWSVFARVGNATKTKWDHTRLDKTGAVDISCNGRVVYSFRATDIHFGLSKAQSLIYELEEHSFNFSDPDSEIGRKIWYKKQPAIIDNLSLDLGSIGIRYDGDKNQTGFTMTSPWDSSEDIAMNDWHGKEIVRDDVLSPHIWWFRE